MKNTQTKNSVGTGTIWASDKDSHYAYTNDRQHYKITLSGCAQLIQQHRKTFKKYYRITTTIKALICKIGSSSGSKIPTNNVA